MGKKQRQLEVRDAGARYYPSNTLSLEQLSHWIAFSRVIGIGPARFKRLLDFFHDDRSDAWAGLRVEIDPNIDVGAKSLAQKLNRFDSAVDLRPALEPFVITGNAALHTSDALFTGRLADLL